MINIIDKSTCCGCTACASICSHNAIEMVPDSLGFLYPKVDNSSCVDCGLCNAVCQFNNTYKRFANYDKPLAYQFRLKDEYQLQKSQSGGAFYAIASYFISIGGVVYGAAFTDSWKVAHARATSLIELEKLRMSKYVQSNLQGVFCRIKEDLRNRLPVLFSGTACQVAGLKSYIPKRLHENLMCMDIICHGVPSPKIWEDYIAYLQKTRNAKIVKACFRDKRFGWHGAKESFLYDNGKEEFRATSNCLYFTGISIRESCSRCHFTNLKRVGDITIGDQWGISKDSVYEDGKGLSVILINSLKGQQIFDSVELVRNAESIELKQCLQPQLQQPTLMHPLHEKFIDDYKCKGFLYIAKRYSDMGWIYPIKQLIVKIKIFIISNIRK